MIDNVITLLFLVQFDINTWTAINASNLSRLFAV